MTARERITGVGTKVLGWIDALPGPSRAYTVGLAVVGTAAALAFFFIL